MWHQTTSYLRNVRSIFPAYEIVDQLKQGVNICQMFNVSPNDLFFKWEALNYNNSKTLSFSKFSLDSAHALKAQIQRSLAANTGRKPKNSLQRFGPGPTRINLGRIDGVGTPADLYPTSESRVVACGNGSSKDVSSPSRIFFKRLDHHTVGRKNGACESLHGSRLSIHRCHLPQVRYMCEKISERSEGVLIHYASNQVLIFSTKLSTIALMRLRRLCGSTTILQSSEIQLRSQR
jgi:hypothetical protein